MRSSATVSPQFWTGVTGRSLRQHPDAHRLALYLVTCPNSTMIGLYYLPLPTSCHELGMTPEGASEALRSPVRELRRGHRDGLGPRDGTLPGRGVLDAGGQAGCSCAGCTFDFRLPRRAVNRSNRDCTGQNMTASGPTRERSGSSAARALGPIRIDRVFPRCDPLCRVGR